jgi:ABC-type multidrug transport system permease subunit
LTSPGSALRLTLPVPALWRVAEVLRLGWREFLAANPPRLLLSATAPRFLLQTLFFTVLGNVVAGPGQRGFAFVGGLAIALAGANVVNVANVPVADKQYATFWRIRSGRLSPAIVFLSRSAPYPVAGFAILLADAALVGPLTGLGQLTVRLLPLAWVYALISVTTTAAGLAAASLSIGRHADILVTNLLAYLVILGSGGFLPPGRIGWVDGLGSVLPVTHGLAAIRAALAGRPWGSQIALELLVGLCWTAVAAATISLQARRARRLGNDDYS